MCQSGVVIRIHAQGDRTGCDDDRFDDIVDFSGYMMGFDILIGLHAVFKDRLIAQL